MSETIILQEGNVLVTTSRFVSDPTLPGCLALLVGGIGAFVGVGVAQIHNAPGLGVAIGIAAFALMAVIVSLLPPTAIVVLTTGGSDITALKSRDGRRVDRIVKALNDAIVARG